MLRSTALALPLIGLLACSGATAQAPEQAPPADTPSHMPREPETIPFELQDNLVRIGVTVNGQRLNAVLDSGASAIVVDQTASRRLRLDEGRPMGEAAGAGPETPQFLPVTLADIEAGPLRFRNAPGYAVDLGELSLSARFPIDFLLGAPAFKHGAVTVDYARRTITFGPSGSAPKCAAPIPIEIVDDAPIAEIQLRPTRDAAPIALKVVVDLGTRHNAVILGGAFLRTAAGQALLKSGSAQQVGHGIGGKVQGAVARVAEMRMGSSTFGELDVALAPDTPAFERSALSGTLGVPLWEKGTISFDYPARQLCITGGDR